MKKNTRIAFLMAVVFYLAAALPAFSQTTIRLQPFLSGLTSPVYITNAHDGSRRLFVVQQNGIIKVVQPGTNAVSTFLDVSTVIASGGERGLLGLAFHPLYATNRRFFVYYTRASDGAITIAEYRTSVNDPNVAEAGGKVIITIPHPTNTNHNGGTLEFGPDGYLYFGTGDGGSSNDPPNNAQNIDVLLGKMLRININTSRRTSKAKYLIPPDNPYVGTAGADEIYAIGLRNPYRWSFDRGGTRQLWVADVGQSANEEVDIVTRGGNYGWRIMEGTICTPGVNPNCTPPAGHIPPIFQYGHASGRCSITGGYVYRGTQNVLPQGSYIYGDYCTGEIWYWNGAQQILLLDTTRNISSFGEDEDGELYLVGLGSGTVEKITTP